MQTLTIRADEALINQIKTIAHALAKANNQELETIAGDEIQLIADYEQRADEALQGKGLINEGEALARAEQIKSGVYASKI